MLSEVDRARPVYLTTAEGGYLHLYLAPRGEWSQDAKTVKSIKRHLRKKGFTINAVRRSSALYGVYDVPCIQFSFYDRLDEDHKLEVEEVEELRKLIHARCSAMAQAQATEIYYHGHHLNTEVTLTVHEGSVISSETDRPYIGYSIVQTDNTYSFYLSRPLGEAPESPSQAATTVAEALGVYTPNRIVPIAIGRRKVALRTDYDDSALDYM